MKQLSINGIVALYAFKYSMLFLHISGEARNV